MMEAFTTINVFSLVCRAGYLLRSQKAPLSATPLHI